MGTLQHGCHPWQGTSAFRTGQRVRVCNRGELQVSPSSISETSISLSSCGLRCAIRQPNGERSVSCASVCCFKKAPVQAPRRTGSIWAGAAAPLRA